MESNYCYEEEILRACLEILQKNMTLYIVAGHCLDSMHETTIDGAIEYVKSCDPNGLSFAPFIHVCLEGGSQIMVFYLLDGYFFEESRQAVINKKVLSLRDFPLLREFINKVTQTKIVHESSYNH